MTELLQVDTVLRGWKKMCQLHRKVSENLDNDSQKGEFTTPTGSRNAIAVIR